MNSKQKNNKNLITIIIFVAIIVLLVLIAILNGHNKKIPKNPEDTIGNTSGNLNNNGLFCEKDGIIYFANCYDDYSLYAMDAMTMDARQITDASVKYLNIAGDYIYFYFDDDGSDGFWGVAGNRRGVYRVKTKSKNSPICLDRSTSGIVSLLGNKLYYQHYDNVSGMTLYSVTTDGKDKEMICNEIVNPACIINSEIYYPDQNNMFYLNAFNTLSNTAEPYISERMYNPTLSGNYIFYMNVDDNYSLYRYDIYSQAKAKLTNERVDCFNVYENSIFMQTNSAKNPCLMHMNIDGSSPEIIANGIYTDINCTSTYTFFRAYESEDLFYMVPTQGYGQVMEFHPYTNE